MKPGEVGMLTEEQVAEIRARCEAATEGPWESTGDQIVTYAVPKTASHPVQPISVGDVFIEYEDAEFCAHAREDIPALLAALDEQAVEIARLKGLACVDYWGCPIPGMIEANDGLRAENERLRAVAEKCRSHIGTGNATVDFEAAAERFRRDTHMMAPGKSEAPGWNSRYTYDERQLAWQMWHEQQTSDIRAALAALTQEATDETR